MQFRHARVSVLVLAAAALALWVWQMAPTQLEEKRDGAQELAAIVSAPAQPASARAAQAEPSTLDARAVSQRASDAAATRDAFSARSWIRKPPPAPRPPPTPAAEVPTPAPQPPPLPFKYLGRLEEEGAKTVWYLAAGERVLAVSAGDSLAGGWRVDGYEQGQLQLTYLPMNIRQSLAIGGTK